MRIVLFFRYLGVENCDLYKTSAVRSEDGTGDFQMIRRSLTEHHQKNEVE